MESLGSLIGSREQSNLGKGWVVSLIAHIVFIILMLISVTISTPPPPESEGLLVNLGLPDEGQGDEVPKGSEEKPVPTPAETEMDEIPQVASKTASAKPAAKSITATDQSDVIASQQAEAKRKANEEAQRRAAEEAQRQASYNKAKKSYGDLLGTGGKGNTGKPGSQGDPNGDPNSNILEGISTGSGRVGGGLGNRGVLHEPQISDRSQKTGRVVINVCVDQKGKVIKAEYTQKGSTTTDSELKEIARKAALQFRFTDSDVLEQCGTITVDFKIKG